MNLKLLENYTDYIYALLRILTGLVFILHGAQKVICFLAASQPPIGSQLWIGVFIELLVRTLIVLGWQTRIAAFIFSGMMAVSYIQFHWKFQFGTQFSPAINHGELSLFYCFVLLYITSRGGVRWYLDKT
jgi:putative oxidoreductase